MLEQLPQLTGLQDVVGLPVFTMPPVLSPEAPGKKNCAVLRCSKFQMQKFRQDIMQGLGCRAYSKAPRPQSATAVDPKPQKHK